MSVQRTDAKERFFTSKECFCLLEFLVPLLRKVLILSLDLTHATDKKLNGACEDICCHFLQGSHHCEAPEAMDLNIRYTRMKSKIAIHPLF